jgi:hypothetical protein
MKGSDLIIQQLKAQVKLLQEQNMELMKRQLKEEDPSSSSSEISSESDHAFDQWVVRELTKDLPPTRIRKRTDRLDPSILPDDRTKADVIESDLNLIEFESFCNRLAKEGYRRAKSDYFFRTKWGDLLESIKNGAGFEHPEAKRTFDHILEWACSDERDEVAVLESEGKARAICCFCNLSRSCTFTLAISQKRLPLGSSCRPIAEALIEFGAALWRATERDDKEEAFEETDRAFSELRQKFCEK